MRILAYDIETRPHLVYTWGLFNQNISLNQIVEPGGMFSFAARWVDEPKSNIEFRSVHHDGHTEMVERMWDLIDEADALVSWNGAGFDTKHVNREFVELGMTPPSPIIEVDLLKTARRRWRFASNKLDHVSQQLGVGSKVKHEGMPLWTACMAGDDRAWSRMRRYNIQDVHLLVDLYNRMLPWIIGLPNINLDTGLDGCPRPGCGGRLEKRGFRRTGVGLYQRYRCRSCGGWSSSGKAEARTDIREDK